MFLEEQSLLYSINIIYGSLSLDWITEFAKKMLYFQSIYTNGLMLVLYYSTNSIDSI